MYKIFLTVLIVSLGVVLFTFGQTDLEIERSELEEELKRLEEEIGKWEREMTRTEAEKESLRHQISLIENRIGNLNYQIQRNRIVIQDLGLKIEDTEDSIYRTTLKIEDSQKKLEEILLTIYMEDRKDSFLVFLEEEDLSSFFSSIALLDKLSEETKGILDEVKSLKSSLESEKATLSSQKTEAEQTARMQEAQRREEAEARAERERLYGLTEEEYQRQLEEKQKLEAEADEIRQRIFELVGLPDDVDAPTFEEAYEISKWVEGMTGIRPAFLLSILQQESAMGKNVGQCYIADKSSGASVHIHNGQRYSNGIHPTRDIPPFLEITRDLGMDPLKTPVSCPMSFGWGGAMGPAQFIPSTWAAYKGIMYNLLGRHANPWSIRDSFLASGVLLTDSGAKSRTKDGEWRAAMIYFSGGTTNSQFFWYADQVIQRADRFENEIRIMLEN